jgi:ribosomal protein S27AE
MSENKPCPYCGGTNLDEFDDIIDNTGWWVHCGKCGAQAPLDKWNRRVMQWVPVAERLPEKDGYYIVKKAVTHSLKYDTCAFKDGKWYLCWEGCETRSARSITHWLDDHTFDEEQK